MGGADTTTWRLKMNKMTVMTCLTLAALGCGTKLDTDAKTACRTQADCVDGFTCSNEVCVADHASSNNIIVIDDIETVEDYNRAAWNTVCDTVFACPNEMTLPLIALWYARYDSAAECQASYEIDRGAFDTDLLRTSKWEDAILNGRIEFDGDAASDCLEGWAASVCAAGFDVYAVPDPEQCPGVLTPKQDVDEPCVFQQECRSPLMCDAFTQETCGGVCVTTNSVGDCNGVACAATEYCDISAEEAHCRTSKADGEPCAPFECGRTSLCLGGDFDGTLGVCTARRSLGPDEQCDDTELCEPGLYCHRGEDDEIGRCVTLAFDRAAGEPCEPGHFCEPGLACVPDGELTKFVCGEQLAAGSPCVGDSQCEPGLHCDGWLSFEPGSEGVCAEPSRTAGESCNWSMECETGICDSTSDVCVASAPVCEI